MHPRIRASARPRRPPPPEVSTERALRPAGLLVGLALGAFAAAACTPTPRTEVFVVVEAEPGVALEAASLTIAVRGAAAASPEAFSPATVFERSGGALAFPVSLGVVPKDGDASRRFEIVVTAAASGGDRVGEARARGTFVAGRTHLLRVELEDACIPVRCGATETCRAGVCEDAEVDVASLPLYGPGAPPGPADAGADLDTRDADTTDADAPDSDTPDLGPLDLGVSDLGDDAGGLTRPPPSIWAAWELPGTPPHARAYLYDAISTTVLDLVTGLEWERTADGSPRSQATSAAYCEGLELDGKSDWRLPSRIELASLVDYARFNPTIDRAVFPAAQARQHWTRSPVAREAGKFWLVGFADGVISRGSASAGYHARCVR